MSKLLQSKIALRRWMLRAYAPPELRVLDCCHGAGRVWATLKKEFELNSFFAIDKKPNADSSAIEIDPAALLQKPRRENVIDIDSNSSPWLCFQRLLPNLDQPTIVFLTWRPGSKTKIENRAAALLGLDKLFEKINLPDAVRLLLAPMAGEMLLSDSITFCEQFYFHEYKTNVANSRLFGCYLSPKK